MKFNGKKAIMASALSAIVAANSFGTVMMADAATAYYTISMGSVNTSKDVYGYSLNIVDVNGKNFPGNSAVPGQIYKVVATPNPGLAVLKITIDDVDVCYPNATGGTYYYPFTMPAHNCHVAVTFGTPGSLTPPTSKPDPKPVTPTPSTPTPTPSTPTPSAPTPTPTNLRGDADVNGVVNVQDATLVLKHAAKLTKLTGQGYINADVNNDGNINVADATEILKIAAKLA